MTGERESDNGRCPLCGGHLTPEQNVTIPFVVDEKIVVVRNIPAEVCNSCHEPYLTGAATDRVVALLKQFRSLPMEVSIVLYHELTTLETAAGLPVTP